MFATLAGAYPVGPLAGHPDVLGAARRQFADGDIDRDTLTAAEDAYVAEIVGDQVVAGLDFPCDGLVRGGDVHAPFIGALGGVAPGNDAVDPGTGRTIRGVAITGEVRWNGPVTVGAWQAVANASELVAKAIVPGPYTFGRLTALTGAARERATIGLAEALGVELEALADAGCQIIQITEDGADVIGADDRERSLYWRAHRRLTDRVGNRPGVHLSLALAGDAFTDEGIRTVLDAPYRSYLLDLRRAPGAWQLVHEIPADRGVICGVVDASTPVPDAIPTLVWAMHLASAARDRGDARVGIAPSGSMAGLGRAEALVKLETMGSALAEAGSDPLAEVAERLDASPGSDGARGLRDLRAAAAAGREMAERAARRALLAGRAAAGAGAQGAGA